MNILTQGPNPNESEWITSGEALQIIKYQSLTSLYGFVRQHRIRKVKPTAKRRGRTLFNKADIITALQKSSSK